MQPQSYIESCSLSNYTTSWMHTRYMSMYRPSCDHRGGITGHLGTVWAPFKLCWGYLGSCWFFWSQFGSSWGYLEPYWDHPGAILNHVEVTLDHLGAILRHVGASGGHVGKKPIFGISRPPPTIDFASHFGVQNWSKNQVKIGSLFEPVFHWFGPPLWEPNRPRIGQDDI